MTRAIRPGTIRSQLLAALILVVLLAAAVAAAAMVVVLRAERDFRDLAENRIPAVALSGELAEVTGDLAALAVRVVAEPGLSHAEIAAAAEAAEGIAAVLAAPGHAGARRDAVLAAEMALRSALVSFGETGAALTALASAEARADSELRWTHGDVQDQAQALLQDLSFNMEAQLSVLAADNDPGRRAGAEALLSMDRPLRDRMQRLASEAATLVALLLQARSADTPHALDQVVRLGDDTLDAIALARLNLPTRTDVTLFLDRLDDLIALTQGPDSIYAQARARLGLRAAAMADLAQAQAALAAMQSQLTALGRAERVGAQQAADTAARTMFSGAMLLAGVTVLAVILTAVILFYFVHGRILLRIEALSDSLRRIARGELSSPATLSGRDEIAAMGRAVEVFRAATAELHATHLRLSAEVAERQRAVERLEQTQRDLVQAGKMAALGQMSAAISHEINQPLAAMRHRLHQLAGTHPEAAPAIARIEAMVARITATIGHLRRIARRADHTLSCVALAQPLEAALALLERRLRSEGVRVEVDDTLGALEVSGNDILLEQVLLNVLGNALDAIAEAGRGGGVIRLVCTGDDPVTIRIIDDGTGLGGRSAAELVDPFQTTKEPGKGLGLGLSIAFNVMQDMGGHLEISQHSGGGAEVSLRLNRWHQRSESRYG